MAAPTTDVVLEPGSSLANISCFDLLLIELVPLAERMARTFEASLDRPPASSTTKRGTTKPGASTSAPASASTSTSTPVSASTSNIPGGANLAATPSTAGGAGAPGMLLAGDGLPETDVFRDNMYVRLERLGFRVGQGLSERFSRDRPRFTDPLDAIKFVCKDLWTVVFKKQIDNLKTNHRGVFVLTDNKFRPFSRMSMATTAEAIARAQPHLYFPCGIIRGVLSTLGIKATVQAETNELPTATFQIKTLPAKT